MFSEKRASRLQHKGTGCVMCSGRVDEGLRLIGALIIVRHGHRAPMYSLPNHHSPSLNCRLSNVQSSRIDRTQAAGFTAEMDSLSRRGNFTDPSWRRYGLYPASTPCSGAQLTADGALQMLRVGLLLRRSGYPELATSGVVVRASEYSRTVQSAAALLYGLAGESSNLVDSARVELARDAYLCMNQRRALSGSPWSLNVTCGCRSALTALALRRRHNRTRDADERQLRTDVASTLNVTASRLPWTSAILEVSPANILAHSPQLILV